MSVCVHRRGFYIHIQTTVRQAHHNTETTIPADLLLIRGACIDDDGMFSGESTPLLKESIEPWEADACLDVGGAHKTAVLFGGTNDVFIVLIYIYIYSFNYILFCSLV